MLRLTKYHLERVLPRLFGDHSNVIFVSPALPPICQESDNTELLKHLEQKVPHFTSNHQGGNPAVGFSPVHCFGAADSTTRFVYYVVHRTRSVHRGSIIGKTAARRILCNKINESKMGQAAKLVVVTADGYAYERPDGVSVVHLFTLGP